MKGLLRDAVALLGLGALSGGLYIEYGKGIALMVIGSLLLLAVLSTFRHKGD